jgi:curved DNA-binding protein CbpA
VPTLISTVDIRALPLKPMEAFVLSRVDGRATASEISVVTGLGLVDVTDVLTRLARLGAVHFEKRTDEAASPAQAAPEFSNLGDIVRADAPRPLTRPHYDPAELAEPADLDFERKRLVLDTYYGLDGLNHYELFRIPTSAEKKVIKRAYYDVVALFHPDKYFGKNLGKFKPKLERIFSRITEAHDTLTKPASREEYDSYLASQRATAAFDDEYLERIQRELEAEARHAAVERPSQPPPAPQKADPASAGDASESRGTGPSVNIPPQTAIPEFRGRHRSPEERRRALARKLGASIPPPPGVSRISSVPPPVDATQAHEAAAEALRHRYEARLSRLRDERVERYAEQAEQATSSKNLIAAANFLRIATSLDPQNALLSERYQDAERSAAAVLADQYLEQARYDERRGHFAEAAKAYERVLRGKPTALAYERAAFCLLESRADMKRAVEYARKAVELGPQETAYRITLARVFARAGMEQSAIGELERARTLDPSDDTIKDWIKRIRRGEI